jgi:hypothetical protein
MGLTPIPRTDLEGPVGETVISAMAWIDSA